MARSFNGSSDVGSIDAAPVTAVPLTIACWFYQTNAAQETLVYIGDKDDDGSSMWTLEAGGGGTPQIIGREINDAGNPRTCTASSYSQNVWNHGGVVYASSSSRTAYLNGAGGSPNTNGSTVTGADRISVGVQNDAAPSQYFTGRIAEVGVWNAALSANEMAALARGVSPLKIRTGNLVFYAPLWGRHSPEIDLHPKSVLSTDFSLTLSGTTAGNHAPVAPLSRRFWIPTMPLAEVAVGGTTKSRSLTLTGVGC